MGQLIRNNLEVGRVDIKDQFPTYWQYATDEDILIGTPFVIKTNGIYPTIKNVSAATDVVLGIVVRGNNKSDTIFKNSMIASLHKGCISVPFNSDSVKDVAAVFYDFDQKIFSNTSGTNTVSIPNAFFYTNPELRKDGTYSIMLNIYNDLRVISSGSSGVTMDQVNTAITTATKDLVKSSDVETKITNATKDLAKSSDVDPKGYAYSKAESDNKFATK